MSDIYVIYWSGTGNTEMMAGAVAEGIHAAGGHANVLDVASASADVLKDAKAFALGCPAMGSEQLEEGDMEPFVEEVEKFAAGKTIGLFGSYDWGDGDWMREWASRMEAAGATVAGGKGVIANNTPDEEALENCRKLGETLAAV
ncbi:flavodoxin [Lachnospiraceae bacterium HCP1S3_A8]|nr:flavodoxin [Lachnospiraceae bacterium]